jgi:crotonobetainyl-CoA:carnitine CoA-transferase CaiB-like acyl-CoA transferase
VGGSCRLLRAADGWVAVSLARPDDAEAVSAAVGFDDDGDPWGAIETFAASAPAAAVADRAQLLGIPVAALGANATRPTGGSPVRTVTVSAAPARRRPDRPLVIDLSSLWAGPLCAHLLGRAGARVVKVESAARPDGARRGDPRFFDWLHAGHESVVLALDSARGRATLRSLLGAADIVIEASRPRALRQLGIVAEDIVDARGTTWVSITGYGRDGTGAGRVAFGDDAAVAGGLVAWDDEGGPVFCGDAIADPLTGLYAAAAVTESLATGGARFLDVAMNRVAAHVAGRATTLLPVAAAPDVSVLPPHPPVVTGRAPELGADTDAVLAEFGAS